jgi:hypothetical protein
LTGNDKSTSDIIHIESLIELKKIYVVYDKIFNENSINEKYINTLDLSVSQSLEVIGKNDDNHAVASALVILDKTKKELKIYLSKKIEKDTQLEVHVCMYAFFSLKQ